MIKAQVGGKKWARFSNLFYLVSLIIVLVLVIKGSLGKGDFVGYVITGGDTANGRNFYLHYLCTWPPLFSIFCVPIYYANEISPFLTRFIWQMGSVAAFLYAISVSMQLITGKAIPFKFREGSLVMKNVIILIPFAILLKFLMDNLANVQINTYMLLMVILSVFLFTKEKYHWAGLLLAISISLKVYPIFFLIYFLFKREFRVVGWTLLFIALLNSVTIVYWGAEKAIGYYVTWATEIVGKTDFANHKNQSLLGAFYRFFTSEDPSHNMYVNIMDLSIERMKSLYYGIVVLAAVFPAIVTRKKLQQKSGLSALLEYALFFMIIPILSPLSWKAYFILPWFPYFLLFILIYRVKSNLSDKVLKRLKFFFLCSIALNIFSSDLFVGPYISDVLEAYSVITVGCIIMTVQIIFLRINADKFDWDTFKKDQIDLIETQTANAN